MTTIDDIRKDIKTLMEHNTEQITSLNSNSFLNQIEKTRIHVIIHTLDMQNIKLQAILDKG